MIPIKIPENLIKSKSCISQKDYLDKLVAEHYKNIKDNMAKFKAIDDWIKNNLNDVYGKSYDFEIIIKAPIIELRKIKKWIDSQGTNWGKESKNDKHGRPVSVAVKQLKSIVNWYNSSIDKVSFIKNLGITVCPYCNRNFINIATTDGKDKVTSQIEHFFPKSKYPVFALSFYNLIPVCPACNKLKGENEMGISMYDIQSHSDMLEFDFIPLAADYLSNKEHIHITTNCTKDMKSNVKVLGLNSLYQIHTDYIQEILKKKEIYTKVKIDEIYNDFHELFSNKGEVYRIIFGNYMQDDEVHKRPLAKLTIDICRKVDII